MRNTALSYPSLLLPFSSSLLFIPAGWVGGNFSTNASRLTLPFASFTRSEGRHNLYESFITGDLDRPRTELVRSRLWERSLSLVTFRLGIFSSRIPIACVLCVGTTSWDVARLPKTFTGASLREAWFSQLWEPGDIPALSSSPGAQKHYLYSGHKKTAKSYGEKVNVFKSRKMRQALQDYVCARSTRAHCTFCVFD